MKRRHERSRSGFVFIAALLLIAVIGAAMGAISAAVSADARRTVDQARDAQLEQMLLAGVADAPARLAAQAPVEGQAWALPLPESLSSQSASLDVRVGPVQPNGSAMLLIRATIDGRHAEQTASFNLTNNTWALTSAELGDR